MKAKLLFPFLVLLIGCTTGNSPLSEAQKEAVKKEAVPVVKDFYDAMAANDTAKFLSLIDFSSELVDVNPSGILNSDEMRKVASQYFAMVEKQTFETKTEKYTVVDPGCFIYTWQGRNGVYIKGIEPIIYDDLLGSYTFKKTKGDWKIVYMHESAKVPEVSDPVTEFTKIEEGWMTAITNKDTKALEQLYASEYRFIDSRGHVTDRQQDISEITGTAYKVLAPFVLSDLNVTLYGTVAMVTGSNAIKAMLNGKDISGTVSFTDFFVYRDGRWQCFFSQARSKPAK
jgi:ketosteroid isomerase-like protein